MHALTAALPAPTSDFRANHPLYVVRTEAAPLPLEGLPPTPIRTEQDLVVQLARMPIDISAPLLKARLSMLDTQALLALVAATGEAHHKLIAGRPGLDWRVIRALIRSNSDEVLLTLAENHRLEFDAEDQAALARLSESRIMLRAAILANPRLSLAHNTVKLNLEDGLTHRNLRLVRLLRAGDTVRFMVGAANAIGCEATALQRFLTGASATPLAMTCRALDIDRAVFLSLLPHWQAANDGEPNCNAAHRPLVLSVFSLPANDARRKLMAALPA
ncbi:DUF2336 domain-containing protein [Asticcacaulis solisilvae]|uniref:DUF2336 domain-containing protein n=1 Tax=Asticcacaulis solisilvae TaxID=1217274 RepID=UPI003FD762E8